MKKILIIFLLTGFSQIVFSQEIRINTYGGYVFKDKVDSYYSSMYQFGFDGGFVFRIPQN